MQLLYWCVITILFFSLSIECSNSLYVVNNHCRKICNSPIKVIWQYLVLISLTYLHIDFQGQISKEGNHNVMCTLWSSGGFPKMEIAPFGLAILGNVCSLLVVMSSKKMQYLPQYWMSLWCVFCNIFLICMCTYPPCWNAKNASGFCQNATCLAHCCQQWWATNDNISVNAGCFCGAFFGISLLWI